VFESIQRLFGKRPRPPIFQIRVVIGYGRERALKIVKKLKRFIPEDRFRTWATWRGAGTVVASEKFREQFDQRLVESDVLLMVWTSDSHTSEEARRELERAIQLSKTIMPVVEDGAERPPQFDGITDIKFAPGRAREHFQEIVKSLEEIRVTKEHTWGIRVTPE
jgi:hypothetical protein